LPAAAYFFGTRGGTGLTGFGRRAIWPVVGCRPAARGVLPERDVMTGVRSAEAGEESEIGGDHRGPDVVWKWSSPRQVQRARP